MPATKVGKGYVDLEDLKAKTDLTALYGDGKVICPWHNDTSPSLHIYPDHVYCYACNKQADAIGFVMEVEDISFVEAVAFLQERKASRRLKLSVDTQPVDTNEVLLQHQRLADMSARTFAWRWLNDRGLERHIVNELKVGWTGRSYAIPHYINGSVGNVKYRIHPDKLYEHENKYTSLPHREFTHLYPWDYYRREHGDNPVLFITEGEFDAMLLLQSGVPALSLPSGVSTPWSDAWVSFFKTLKVVYVAYDMDRAGVEAANKLNTDKGKLGRSVVDMLEETTEVHRLTWDEELGKDITEARKVLVPAFIRQYEYTQEELHG